LQVFLLNFEGKPSGVPNWVQGFFTDLRFFTHLAQFQLNDINSYSKASTTLPIKLNNDNCNDNKSKYLASYLSVYLYECISKFTASVHDWEVSCCHYFYLDSSRHYDCRKAKQNNGVSLAWSVGVALLRTFALPRLQILGTGRLEVMVIWR